MNTSEIQPTPPSPRSPHRHRILIPVGILVLVVVAIAAYYLRRPNPAPQSTRAHLTGYVLEVRPEQARITVRNADMPGVMDSMVMDYHVADSAALTKVEAGDVIEATMVVDSGRYSLEDIKVTGKR